MVKKKTVQVLLLVLILVISSGVGGYFIGQNQTTRQFKTGEKTYATFYATITAIYAGDFRVQGIAENSTNYEGAFDLKISGQTLFLAADGRTALEAADFQVDDEILVRYHGVIQEIFPARILEVDVIQKTQ